MPRVCTIVVDRRLRFGGKVARDERDHALRISGVEQTISYFRGLAELGHDAPVRMRARQR